MAEEAWINARTMLAGTSLTPTMEKILVRHSGPGVCDIASNPAGGPNSTVGILRTKAYEVGGAVALVWFGETRAIVGGPVTAGMLVAPNGSGRCVAANSGDWVAVQALETATADGEEIRVLVSCPARMLTTSLNL